MSARNRIVELFMFNRPNAVEAAAEIVRQHAESQSVKIDTALLVNERTDIQFNGVASELLGALGVGGYKFDDKIRFLNCVLTNFVANVSGQPVATAIPTGHRSRGTNSAEMVKPIMDRLVSDGYIQKIKHSQDDGRAAAYLPSLKLSHMINTACPAGLITRKPSLNEVTMNDGISKVALSVRRFPEATMIRKKLLMINQHIQSFPWKLTVRTALSSEIVTKAPDGWIERDNLIKALLHHPDAYRIGTEFSYETDLNTVLKRSFYLHNGKLLGGRFWGKGAGNYQGLKRDQRKNDVTLFGQILPEPDLKSAQYAIAYALAGSTPPDNCYIFERGNPKRAAVKSLGLVMLNAESAHDYKAAALADITDKVLDGRVPVELLGWFTAEYRNLRAQFEELHRPMVGMFGTSACHELQFYEALVMGKVMNELMRRGLPFLPVHDAIKVLPDDVGNTVELMDWSFSEVLGVGVGVDV